MLNVIFAILKVTKYKEMRKASPELELNKAAAEEDFIFNLDKWDQTDPIRDASDPTLFNI